MYSLQIWEILDSTANSVKMFDVGTKVFLKWSDLQYGVLNHLHEGQLIIYDYF